MPPASHVELIDCPDCHNAMWRYKFYHPGHIAMHIDFRERDVCPGYLKRKEIRRQHTCALCRPDGYVESPFLMKCDDCDDYFHNADHSDCMARHQREVHGHEWSTPNVVMEVPLSPA